MDGAEEEISNSERNEQEQVDSPRYSNSARLHQLLEEQKTWFSKPNEENREPHSCYMEK